MRFFSTADLVELGGFPLTITDDKPTRHQYLRYLERFAAETGMAVFKVAFARWVSEPGQPDLPGIFRELMAELRGALTDRAPV